MNGKATDSFRDRNQPGQLEEASASELDAAPCRDSLALTEADLSPNAATLAQMQKSFEKQLQELHAEITRQSFADRQLRARASRRAADAREEALDALSRAAVIEHERDKALARAAEASERYTQAEHDKANAHARWAALHAQWAALDAQSARERDEAQERILQLESSLQYTVALLNSIQKAQFLGGIQQRIQQWRQVKLIRKSPLFEAGWYVQRYPQVMVNGLDPAYDYLWNANLLDRDPSPKFDTSWYRQHCPDVARAGMNPLLHYILFGAAEGRQIRPVE